MHLRLLLLGSALVLLSCCSTNAPSSAVVDEVQFSANDIVQNEKSVEKTMAMLERSFEEQTLFSLHGVRVLYLHPEYLKAEIRARHEHNLSLSSEDIEAEQARQIASLASERNCFQYRSVEGADPEAPWRFFEVQKEDGDWRLDGVLNSAGLLCFKEHKEFAKSSLRLLVVNSERASQHALLEWKAPGDSTRRLTKEELASLAEKALSEDAAYTQESLDLFSQDEVKRKVVLKALSAHSMRYLQKELPLSASDRLSPADRSVVLNYLALYAAQNQQRCQLSVVEHLLKLHPTRKENVMDKIAKDFPDLDSSYACPEWARYVYKWFPKYRDHAASGLNKFMVAALEKYTPVQGPYLLRVANSYKYVRDQIALECQQGKREQCVILEVINKNFAVLSRSIEVIRGEQATNGKRNEKLLELLEELRLQRKREEGRELPEGKAI